MSGKARGRGLREMKWLPSLDPISKLWEVGEPFPTSGPSVPTDPPDSRCLISLSTLLTHSHGGIGNLRVEEEPDHRSLKMER